MKFVSGVAAVMLVVAGMASSLPAAAGEFWQTLTVQEAGVNAEGNVEILFHSQDRGAAKRFVAAPGEEKMILAIALTAISAAMPVTARMDWAVPGSQIMGLRLVSQ